MKKKNGFTLIELLAIIVILAIIAVITVPIILDIIDNSKKGAASDSAYGYKDAIEKYYVTKLSKDPSYSFSGVYGIDELKLLGVSVSGQEPTEGWIKIEKGKIIDYSIKFDDYVANLDESTGNISTTKNGEIKTSDSSWFEYTTPVNGTVSITGFSTEYTNNHSNVKDIIIPTKDSSENTITGIIYGAFSRSDITSVVISDNIDTITNGAFQNATSLTSVVFNNKVNLVLGGAAFENTSIEYIYIPKNVSIESNNYGNVFKNSKIKRMYIDSKQIGERFGINLPDLEYIVLGDNVETIGTMAFQTRCNLKNITIGLNVSSIGNLAFGGCCNWGLGETTTTLEKIYNKSTSINIDNIKDDVLPGRTGYEIINQF